MTISRKKFCAAARAVYGQKWQSSLALRVGVSRQQVHKWAKGDDSVPLYAAHKVLSDYFFFMADVWALAASLKMALPKRPPFPKSLTDP